MQGYLKAEYLADNKIDAASPDDAVDLTVAWRKVNKSYIEQIEIFDLGYDTLIRKEGFDFAKEVVFSSREFVSEKFLEARTDPFAYADPGKIQKARALLKLAP